MIKFFRKIRENLLMENLPAGQAGKTGRYFKYAIGEIVLVVIGILIALSINNWNENRIKKASVNLYLKNLAANIASDTLVMNHLDTVHLTRYYSLQYLLEQSGETKYDPKKEGFKPPPFTSNYIWDKPIPVAYDSLFIHLAFKWSQRLVNQNINTSVIDEIKSTGMFSQIENNALKENINEYYNQWQQDIGLANQAKHNAIVASWEASLGTVGLLTSEVGSLDDPLAIIRDDENRTYLAKRLIREASWMIYNARRINEKAKTLIEQINIYTNTKND